MYNNTHPQPILSRQKKTVIKLTFAAGTSNKLKEIYSKFNLTPVFIKNIKFSNLLHNHKDVTPSTQKSGIFIISCQECVLVIIWQTKRKLQKRFQEHIAHFKHNHLEKSIVAQHIQQ
jgi:hypothetical protein